MGIFDKLKAATPKKKPAQVAPVDRMALANMIVESITDGVIIVDAGNSVQMINPAAAAMVGYATPDMATGVNVAGILRFENGEGVKIEDSSNEVLGALARNESFSTRNYVLVNAQNQRKAVAVTVTPTKTGHGEKVITFRDIAKELEQEGEQTEFISTASHEMRTPVASIEGYLGLALNPQCATIDDRARKYLDEAHASSQHLGRLFKDLLDVTKLDDKKVRLHMVPVEMVDLVKQIVDGQVPAMGEKRLKYTFGSTNGMNTSEGGGRTIAQSAYSLVDVDFLREILNNLIENAIKYTKENGAIWVNVRGDSDRVLVNVTDTGIGISPDDLKHIFQKFYRVDNSQTREIGGTGLGLYIVKMRAEAMGGKVWAESSFGEGSTFYLSLPRLTFEEYERRKQIQANTEMMTAAQQQPTASAIPSNGMMAGAPVQSQAISQPVMAPQPVQQPAMQPQVAPTVATNPTAGTIISS
ncbi:PAS domain-containing protein [Candidatus Saccharibacteria bacterium]|nr:PAS domain-containing protein [Candidatus Saccharibacteria bacterium]